MRLPNPLDPATANTWGASINTALAQQAGAVMLAPASPHAQDDEFDGTSTATWITTPTAPAAVSLNGTVPGALYVEATGTAPIVGRLQTVPTGSFTMTTCVLDTTARGSHTRAAGLLLTAGTASADLGQFIGIKHSGSLQAARISTNLAGVYQNSESVALSNMALPYFVRVIWNGTQLTWEYSRNGRAWALGQSGVAPGFTPTHVGLGINGEGGLDNKVAFAYFRITTP